MAGAGTRKSKPKDGTGTASADEIARFAAMAETWWDPHGTSRALHKMNPVRLAYIRDRVAGHFGCDPLKDHPLKGLSLLDIGCGGGLLSEPMRRLGARVTGIDATEENVRVAQLHAEQSGLDIDYRCVLPEDLATGKRRFDVVLNMEVVEHVADLDAFFRASCMLVKPNGVMAVSTLNRTIKSLMLAKVGAEYVLRWLPVGTHDWRKFVRPSELATGLRRHGVIVNDLSGMIYDPLGDEWRISRDLDVNYLAFGTRGLTES
jgi:2-polyprenyl-6-hydroxyphenyl methylase/3-demethylubiquinone-9 3-methyltransferase